MNLLGNYEATSEQKVKNASVKTTDKKLSQKLMV